MVFILSMSKLSYPKRVNLFQFLILLCVLYIILYSLKSVFIDPIPKTRNDLNITTTVTPHQSLIINGSKCNITSLYYRHATSARNSSYPFISGDTFRAFADYVFDETKQDNLASVKFADIVFVKADMFVQFFGEPFKSINNSFVLVTHNSDFYAPAGHRNFLEDKKIIAWYASNPDLRNHPKIFPIPIGLANTRWEAGNIDKFTYAFQNYRKPWSNRTTLLYVNFSPNSNRQQRDAALSQASKLKDVQIIKEKLKFETYLEQVGNAKFVLSPPGNGLDCHRTWEAVLMGAAPVVLSSGLDILFNRIPSVIINDWSNLTQNLLLSYNFSSYDSLMSDVLYARYWFKRLLKHRDK